MNKKWISRTAVSLGVLTMFGAAGAGSASEVNAAEQNISQNAVSDNTSTRSITIWKYEIDSLSKLGERGDGTNSDPSKAPDLAGKKLMKDANFEIIKVKPIGDASLTDPLKQTEGTDWEVDASFTAMQGKTDADGKLTFEVGVGKKADGIYLVRETKDATSGNYTYTDENGNTKKITKPMDPFFAHLPQTKRDDTSKLIYDVQVYPKNIVTNTELDKTVAGGKGYSVKAGNDFEWEATTKLPAGLYYKADKEMVITDVVDPENHNNKLPNITVLPGDEVYANYFKVTDNLEKQMLLKDVEVYAGSDKLTNGTEYNVTLNGKEVVTANNNAEGNTNTESAASNKIEDLSEDTEKQIVVNLTQEGMKKVTLDGDTNLEVVYKVTTKKDFDGTIGNKYGVDYLIPGQEHVIEESEKNPEYFDGGFDIEKISDGPTSEASKLEGAKFYLATNEENAKAKTYLASDGKSYTLNDAGTASPELPAGVDFITAASDGSGRAEFDGLKLDWFTDNDGNGKQDPKNPEEATWEKEKIEKDYWVVETKAPKGYELIKDPQKVTVSLDTADNSAVELTVVNKKQTNLPFTGGLGRNLVIVFALGAIVIGTAIIAIEKKRRQV